MGVEQRPQIENTGLKSFELNRGRGWARPEHVAGSQQQINLGATTNLRQEKQKGSEPVKVQFFKEASVKEISNLFDFLVSQAQEEHPSAGTYGLFKAVIDQVPKKIPLEAQQKALQAIASEDTITRRLGQKAFLLLNMKTLLTVVDSYFMEGIDAEDEREEMISAAIVSLQEKLAKNDITTNTDVSSQVNYAARDGVADYIARNNNMTRELTKDPTHRRIIATKINDNFAKITEDSSDDNIKNLAEELQRETGISQDSLLEYLRYLKALHKNNQKSVDVNEDNVVEDMIRKQLKQAVAEVLPTLQEREQRVITLRFGLDDNEALTLEEVGREFGVTRMRIRQIEAKALRKLRHPTRTRLLQDYADKDYGHGYIKGPIFEKIPSEEAEPANPYCVKMLFLKTEQKENLIKSGVREIGDFFSAEPLEILEEWSGERNDLTEAVRYVLGYLGFGVGSRAESDIDLLFHVTDGIAYRENVSSEGFSVGNRIGLYRKAFLELLSFFK